MSQTLRKSDGNAWRSRPCAFHRVGCLLRGVNCWADGDGSAAETSWGGSSKSSESEDDELHVCDLLLLVGRFDGM